MSRSGGSPSSPPFRFPGQYHDAETGLNYNYHRYYDPDIAEDLDLLKALHENAAIRTCYPELSHRTVWLSRERLERAGRVHVWVAGRGGYGGEVDGRAETRLTLANLPETIAEVVSLLD